MDCIRYALYLIFVLSLGSFSGAYCYRWPKQQHLNWQKEAKLILGIPPKTINSPYPKHSRCPSCQHRLSIWDLIPILSFVLLRRRCRYCLQKISARYTIIELTHLMACAALPFLIYELYALILYSLLISALITASFIDSEHYLLPDECLLVAIICAFLTQLNSVQLSNHVLGAIIGFLVIYGLGKLYSRFRKQTGIGIGDAKLTAVLGAWLGFLHLPDILFCACILGILYTVIRVKQKVNLIAFGPFLTFSGIFLFYIKIL
ncbi:prepilin peptidase [Marinomonas posidonica]|uniref:Prepilin leader peptidase/N-methyltransferase n=1 Tax=Marinomonas posidonica (strain CECT 7376 / NCIMB 14433 / IVIA-Po-181) TaxID=491952 RepID=F6CZW0_MARPP|nr:A24 family peptidase [Marinomonas posidonica]AEF54700.1 Prepilin peptidase [Marinomonas posidonica IVIA-Po-181]